MLVFAVFLSVILASHAMPEAGQGHLEAGTANGSSRLQQFDPDEPWCRFVSSTGHVDIPDGTTTIPKVRSYVHMFAAGARACALWATFGG